MKPECKCSMQCPKTDVTKIQEHTVIKLTPLERELQKKVL
jgi:hypothetical protein